MLEVMVVPTFPLHLNQKATIVAFLGIYVIRQLLVEEIADPGRLDHRHDLEPVHDRFGHVAEQQAVDEHDLSETHCAEVICPKTNPKLSCTC